MINLHDQLYYHLSQEYERTLTLVSVSIGVIDFANNTSTGAETSTVTKAVVLPLRVAQDFWKGIVSRTDRLEQVFFFETDSNLKDLKFHIVYNNDKFNIKEVIVLDETHYYVVTTAQVGEGDD